MRQATTINLKYLPIFSLIVLATVPSRGDIVNDFSGSWASVYDDAPIGQSFTAVDPTVHTISFGVTDFNWFLYPNDHKLTVILRSGAGFGGDVVGVVTVANIPLYYDDWLDFVFDPPLSVSIGSTYTFEIKGETRRWGVERYQPPPDTYPEGNAWRLGAAWSGVDLRFRVFAASRPGVCCVGGDCLADVDVDTCQLVWNGYHAGTGTKCEDLVCVRGACCDYYWGSCTEYPERQCRHGYYYFMGRGTSCDEDACSSMGHCCRGETCTQYVQRSVCEQDGGLWLGSQGQCGPSACPPCAVGSLDDDEDYDLRDVQAMQICQGLGAAGGCVCADFDGDRTIGLTDLKIFAQLLAGPE